MSNQKAVKDPFKSQPKRKSPQIHHEEDSEAIDQSEPTDLLKNELTKVGLSEDNLKIGYTIGKQIVQNSKFIDYFSLNGLKPYFVIDHLYVIRRLREIIFPFSFKKEEIIEESNNSLPQLNLDLYIPLMSFITYILLIGFNSAYQQNTIFKPEILGKILSKDFFILLLECFALKLVLFIFSNIKLEICDSFAYVGYKFVLLVLAVIIWIIFPNKTIIFTFIAIVSLWSMFFLYKNLKARFQIESNVQQVAIYIAASLEIGTILLILFDLYYYC